MYAFIGDIEVVPIIVKIALRALASMGNRDLKNDGSIIDRSDLEIGFEGNRGVLRRF